MLPHANEWNLDRTSLRSKRRNAKEVAGVSPTHSSPLRSKPKKGRAIFATPSATFGLTIILGPFGPAPLIYWGPPKKDACRKKKK